MAVNNSRGVVELDEGFEAFAKEHVEKLLARLQSNLDISKKITEYASPDELTAAIDFDPPKVAGKTYAELGGLVDQVLLHAVRTGHPRYYNQLWSESDPMAVLGEWLSTTLNCTMYTYEVAGMFLLMERAVLKRMREKIGWEDGAGDGMLCPGGSICNMQALSFARHNKFPDMKKTGMFGSARCVIFCSAESHYSILKGAFTCGFGTDNVISVACDETGAMDPKAFEAAVEEHVALGHIPLMVQATAGTTVRGMYDPLNPIADVCEKHGIWLHVDGAWGGSVLLSDKYRHLMDGAARADSITWDGHKMLGTPQQCACLLLKSTKGLPASCNGVKAAYLFQPDKPYAELDTGDNHIQCGRRNDVLKFWLAWQSLADTGYAKRVDVLLDLARYMAGAIEKRAADGFVLTSQPACSNVCFFHIPEFLRTDPIAVEVLKGNVDILKTEAAAEFVLKCKKVPPAVKAAMCSEGTMMCGFQPDHGLPNHWRFIITNPRTTEAMLDDALNIIARLGDASAEVVLKV